jgi:hypothetical protein
MAIASLRSFRLTLCVLIGCLSLTPLCMRCSTATPTTPGPPDASQPIAPEDLAVLFPISRDVFKRSYQSEGEFLTELTHHLVPMRQVMSEAFYQQLIAAIAVPSPDGNPFVASEEIGQNLAATPLEQWFITALRFVPCAEAPFPLPSSWDETSVPVTADKKTTLREFTCRPRIRLSVQRFGIAQCPLCNGTGTSDDKALHLVFDFAGGLAQERAARLTELEDKVAAEIDTLQEARRLTLTNVVQLVQTEYTKANAVADLEQLRRELVNRVVELRDASASGALKLSYGAPQALPRYRRYLETRLSGEASAHLITQNFVVGGSNPGFGEVWVLAQYRPTRTLGGLLNPPTNAVRRIPLEFAISSNGEGIKRVSAGAVETFLDRPGSIQAVDPELTASLEVLQASEAKRVFGAMGMQFYGRVIANGDNQATLENHDQTSFAPQRLLPVLQEDYGAVMNTRSHNANATSCMGCHVMTALRLQFKWVGIVGAISRDEKLEINHMDLENVGPNAQSTLNQVQFRQTWFLRAFGYFGQTPCIADRTVVEVQDDVRIANRLLGFATPSMVQMQFIVVADKYATQPGEHIYITGDLAELGSFNGLQGVRTGNPKDLGNKLEWNAEVTLPANTQVLWKPVIVTPDRQVKFSAGPNFELKTGGESATVRQVIERWDSGFQRP